MVLAGCAPAPPPDKTVHLMTGLPLFWGEEGPQAALGDRDVRAPVVRELTRHYRVTPLDYLSNATLAPVQRLILAQPRQLAPAELVALDHWVRAGGALLIFSDPLLLWPSRFAPGDKRRAPLIELLDPLFAHWQLNLENAESEAAMRQPISGIDAHLRAAGRWRSAGRDCRIEADRRLAICSIGRGRVALVADADVLDDRLSRDSGRGAAALLVALLDRVARDKVVVK